MAKFYDKVNIIRAFHEIRDYSLRAATPLVFFDEFDSSYNNESPGWLKYFLAPMQDGVFKEGEKNHPIGRAIFVFAGGTHRWLHEFTRESRSTINETGEDFQRFIAAKGPDFVSRLKGYVNILGPNPINRDDGRDIAPWRDRFEKAALPSLEQLRLHVDAHVFMNILDRDLIIKIASVDRAIHEVYLSGQKQSNDSKIENQSSKMNWDNLDEEVKQLNRMLAENIPYYLLLINCSYRPKPGKSNREDQLMQFTEEEIEYIAQMAHERWVHKKLSKGYTYGEHKDDKKKIHNCIMPWEQLPEELKGVDRNTIKSLPRILDNAGFEIYHLQ
jgi:hypothetical protein